MDKQDEFIKIPHEKLAFYHRIKVGKDIRALIKVVNYLQQWGQEWQEKHS